ncbi:hypothetical protein F5Y11DRAFT_365984 [Daldinia sp. FL1419]|nr:hypothetical protein F5Y11DRAFT_365984 [Daldinia sp. FL1419]
MPSSEPIAIIGSGCRLPGRATSPHKLWELLSKPRDLLRKIDRFQADSFYHPDGRHHGTANSRQAYLLDEDYRLFDAGFFGISPVEAEFIDPLQRIILETVYESLESAGLPIEKLQGSDTAFYAGIMASDYNDVLMRDIDTFPQYFATSTARSIISNRVSYFFDWHGPSMTIDTACSSSMSALHLAVKSLRTGESKIAVAAGGNLFLGPDLFVALSKLTMLSSKGRSAMWDADVDGYGRGEAFVSVVLKPLSDAIRDGDSIECVIRETGANQDGRSKGLTMPSAIAQADLIRQTYQNAGLDLRKSEDQPQFFEAHGTGTKAGDPQEAEAIFNAFFGSGFNASKQENPLYVGSIKTIVGHTEGSAGLAGVLKTSLSLQAGVIAPNMLLKTLNPAITPFYGPFQVPTEAVTWPVLPEGVPRRASVNSFGFGGANVHAILESYSPPDDISYRIGQANIRIITPFVFSASSNASLQNLLSSYKDYLSEHPETDLSSLSWTLGVRRSTLPMKVSFTACSVDELRMKIDEKLSSVSDAAGPVLGIRSVPNKKRILGIFTGQGAQWATMATGLLDALPRAKEIVNDLDNALQSLPGDYRPSWSIAEELSRGTKSSRMQDAAFSQPLCTVVQIILVELLRTVGVEFSAVVGHSSGEIAAAYAAGFISAVDAVKIAHLRGHYASLAGGSNGEKGAMMAIGASVEEAEDLCNLPEFRGRIKLAACNSSSSMTLSGDADAISQAKAVLDSQKKFARLLKVDTAYHSHHMLRCAGHYVKSLHTVGISVEPSKESCVWYSSVLEGAEMKAGDSLRGTYWRDNMANTVQFYQAITSACKSEEPFQMALEIGPHPALKGPATQTLAELDIAIPYAGTLKRGEDDISCLSDCFGLLWTHFGPSAIDFEKLRGLQPSISSPKLLKNLPSYSWDHDKIYWFESRKSKVFRTRSEPQHVLLGTRNDDGNGREYQWRNFLSIREIPWLEGHKIQGQVVYPAAGYVSMALAASQVIASGEHVRLLEIEDLAIGKAIVFDEKSEIEIVTKFWNVLKQEPTPHCLGSITAEFTVSTLLARDHTDLTIVASGKLNITISDESIPSATLPARSPTPTHLIDIDPNKFYSSLEKIGYNYTSMFHRFSTMQRRLEFCTGLLQQSAPDTIDESLLVHPSTLDHAFQALFGAYCWPGDGRFWTLFLPVSIRRVVVDPFGCKMGGINPQSTSLAFDAWMTESPSREMRGDVVFSTANGKEYQPCIQVEGARMVAIADTLAQNDRRMFFQTLWGSALPDGELAVGTERATKEECELAEACERLGYYHWRKLLEQFGPYEREHCADHHKHLFKAIAHYFSREMDGKASYFKEEWIRDDEKLISDLITKYSYSIDIRLQASVGRALPAVIRGETTMLEHMRPDGMLDEYYSHSLGLPASNRYLGRMLKQLGHRYPRMNLIEIGAGTGSSTQAVLDMLDGEYTSYTFTDISSGFFEDAAARFRKERSKVIFKTLDIEKSPADQGYIPHSYDVVIASNVLHATTSLQNTLSNVRALLKPGGYLFLLEITDNTTIRISFIMGGLPGWWLGVNDGRPYSPCVSPIMWNKALRRAGFGGVDAITPAHDPHPNPFSIIATQAIDEKFESIRRPLSKALTGGGLGYLYVLGGRTLDTVNLAEEIVDLLGNRFNEVITIESLEEIDIESNATVISLLDLDGPVFKSLSPQELKSLQALVERSRNLLWVTYAQDVENPYSNGTVGFFRSVTAEIPTLRAQVLDFEKGEKPHMHGQIIAEALLRLSVAEEWEQDPELRDHLLWTTEPELRFKNGELYIQRVVADSYKNDRLNIIRRTINRQVKSGTPVQLLRNDGSWILRQHYAPKSLPSDTTKDILAIKVKYSTLWALRLTEYGPSLFLVIGQVIESSQWVVSLTTQQHSVVHASRALTTPLLKQPEDLRSLAVTALAEVLAGRIADLESQKGGLILVHEPDGLLEFALRHSASQRDFRVKFITEDPTKNDPDWIILHAQQPKRTAKLLIPHDVSTYIHLGTSRNQRLKHLIINCLPRNCNVVEDIITPYSEGPASTGDLQGEVKTAVSGFVSQAQANLVMQDELLISEFVKNHLVSLKELQQDPKRNDPLTILDWEYRDEIPVEISQPQPNLLFKKDKSYMLVGMTGEMGLSLARWMARHGAGTIILSSRNPKIKQAWVDEVETIGARVKISAFDATNRHAWVKFRNELEETLPPLAGVINGAVFLQDQMFLDMDVDIFNNTLAPKIDITVLLDEIFRDVPLDFFLVFSSLSFIIGNRGQANYNAGNAFMTTLVRQRRARGQAASALHLGSVVGVGYLTRAGDVLEQILTKYGYMPVSETDLHHLVAEAIMVGLPDSGQSPEIITGLRYAREGEDSGVHWTANPRFAHMNLPLTDLDDDGDASSNSRAVVSLRAQLLAATSTEEAYKAIQTSFSTKLLAMLQMDPDALHMDTALIELGVDSLVAVEIRSWFLKEINVDVPVLKVLGGASAIELSEYAFEQLPQELLSAIADKAANPIIIESTPTEVKPTSRINLPEVKAVENQPDPDDAAHSSTSSDSPKSGERTPNENTSSSSVSVVEVKPLPEILRRVRISSAQSRFWFLDMFLEDPTSSNITLSFDISGHIRVADLSRALKATAQAHQALRTCFFAEENPTSAVWQGVMKVSKFELEHSENSTDQEVKATYERVRHNIYDLGQGETMRVVLLSKSPVSHTIIFGYHHIVMDGVAFQTFIVDLERAYDGKTPLPQGLQYPEFSEMEGLSRQRGDKKENISYWKREFQEVPPVLPLFPVSKVTARREMGRYDSSYVQHRLDTTLASTIKKIAQKFRVTPSHFYLAAFRILLTQLTGVKDLCIGLADANRHDRDSMTTVGLFLNILPLHFKQNLEATFGDMLTETRTKVYEALGHAGVPFDDILQAIGLPRSSSHSPLFQAFFDYHQGAQEQFKFGGTTWTNADRNPGERAYDITLDIIEGSAGSLVAFIGQDYLYGITEMQTVLDCYIALLKQFADNPKIRSDAARITKESQESSALLDLYQGPRMDFEWSSTLGHRVYEMCQRFPNDIAVKGFPGDILTYKNLERKAQSLRKRLVTAGVSPGPDWIVSLLAIFWAGGVYVPMVHQNPIPRLSAIVAAADPKVILIHKATTELSQQLEVKNTELIDVTRVESGSGFGPISIPISGEDPAVILFTSGSTGTPKGIKLRHRNLINHIEGYVKTWDIGRENVLQQSAFSFDLSIGQIFTALSLGGTLVVANQTIRNDPTALAKVIREEKITWTLLTPSEYSTILQANPKDLQLASSWKHALSCGEALTPKLVREFINLGHSSLRLYNCYGPAEAIISATMAEIPLRGSKPNSPVPIGRPNANYSIYIVDDNGNLVPQGFSGEILIGGCGVGIGYLNNEDLTKEKFPPNAFATQSDRQKGWHTAYLTGDMGRFGSDGLLMYEGRREGDSQVKIRGFRVDLLDIESTLLNAADGNLVDAVVTMRTEAQVLIAHVILSKGRQSQNPTAYLTKLLSSLPLPTYMRPVMAIPVDSFLKNLHGKTDRSAMVKLPLPQELTPISGNTELSVLGQQLIETWLEILPRDFSSLFTIDASSDFFSVGGNSLLLVKLQARIRDVFNVSIPLLQLFGVSILGKMAAKIEESREIERIDWDRETTLGSEIIHGGSQNSGGNGKPSKTDKVVLFTGATGYFGPYLLDELVRNPDVKTVHCLAVRAQSQADAERRIPLSSNPKVVVHQGDLGSSRLGLSRETFDHLSAEADLIVHSGARRSFWDNYSELRGSNVLSTKELIQLALPRRVPVHFLSSSGVLLLNSSSKATEASVATFQPPTDGTEGYVASKWASEVLLENASSQLGIPVIIHRFTPHDAAIPSKNLQAALDALFLTTARLGALPERSTWEGHFDILHSPSTAYRICASQIDDGIRFAHYPSEASMSPKELFDSLEDHLGDKISKRMGLLEWVGAVKKTGYDWLFSTHDLSLTTTEHGVTTKLVNRR